MKVAVLGIGALGSVVVSKLTAAGHLVSTFNRTEAGSGTEVSTQITRARDPATAVSEVQAVITTVADDAALKEVMCGPGGALEALPAKALHLSMSTISPALADCLEELHRRRDHGFVGAPIFGRTDEVAAARALLPIAGIEVDLKAAEPLVTLFGRVVIVGERPAQAHTLKLAGNFLISCVVECWAEAFALSVKYGLQLERVLDVLTSDGLFSTPLHKELGARIISQKFLAPGFKTAMANKDNRLVLQAAERLSVPMPFAGILRDRFLSTMARGEQDRDWTSIATRVFADAGVDLSNANTQ